MRRGNEQVQSWGASILMAGSFLGLVIVPVLLSIQFLFSAFQPILDLLPSHRVSAPWMLSANNAWAAVMLATAYGLQTMGLWLFTALPEQRMGVAPLLRFSARLGIATATAVSILHAVLLCIEFHFAPLAWVLVARAAYACARIAIALYCRREARRWPGGEAWRLPTICVAVVLVREAIELISLVATVPFVPEIGIVAVLVDLTAWFELLRQMRERWAAPDESSEQPAATITP